MAEMRRGGGPRRCYGDVTEMAIITSGRYVKNRDKMVV